VALGGSSGLARITSNGAIPLTFEINGTEAARIDASGRFGLGVSPAAWGVYFSPMQLGNKGGYVAGSTTSYSGNSHFAIGNNGYFDTAGAWRATVNDAGATQYYQITGEHRWNNSGAVTAGGVITFTRAMTLDVDGRLGLGVTSPNTKLELRTDTTTAGSEPNILLNNRVFGTTAYYVGGIFGASYRDVRDPAYIAGIDFYRDSASSGLASSGSIRFYTEGNGETLANLRANGEKMRLTYDGNLLVGATSGLASSKLYVEAANNTGYFRSTGAGTAVIARVDTLDGGTGTLEYFQYGSTEVGKITTNGTLTVYNTTSDYRLKNVIGAVTGHGERLDALEPIEYEWKSNGSHTRGFLAHQFQEVYADSVTGTKDAVDADGNPVYQAMQASTAEVIADLVAEIQSLRKRLADAGI